MSNEQNSTTPATTSTPASGDVIMSSSTEDTPETKFTKLKTLFTKYLKEHTVYETIPENMKILVFNSELTIKDSIEAMIKEDIYCGLLWDTSQSKYVGLFTIRDVLSLIKLAYTHCLSYISKHGVSNLSSLSEEIFKIGVAQESNDDKMEVDDESSKTNFDSLIKNFSQFFKIFDSVTISQYITTFKEKNKKLISLSLDGNLQECIKLIRENKIHRIVVEDLKSSTITGFITYEAIFEFFIENYYSEMTEFNIDLSNINIISKNIITLDKKETIFKCMDTFYSKKISLIPIIDKENGNDVFGYFYLKDIIYFFSNGEKFSFNDTIESFLLDLYEDVDNERPLGKDRIVQIEENENLKNVFEQMSICPERKLIVKSKDDIGVITLSNIFTTLVD